MKKSSSLACCFLTALLLLSLARFPAPAADSAGHTDFNVRAYGATGDGKTLDSPAINQAIAAAAAAGGGTVLVPAGTYLSGSIHLQSNIHLLIDAGATILGAPQDLNAYDETEPFPGIAYQDGGHCYFHNSLIWGENLTNVFITGNGMINGGGLTRDSGLLDQMCGYEHFQMPRTNTMPPVRLGNKSIALKLCKNVLIRDVTIFHGGHFAILVTGCDNLTVPGIFGSDHGGDSGISLPPLRSLSLQGCLSVVDLAALSGLRLLSALDLSGCVGITDISPLAGLPRLRRLDLGNCTGLADITPLSSSASGCSSSLTTLDLSGCPSLTDLRPLALCSALSHLTIMANELADPTVSGGGVDVDFLRRPGLKIVKRKTLRTQ